MSAWVNPLDRVPQVPSDWANHILYGGALGAAFAVLAHLDGFNAPTAWLIGTAVSGGVCAVKKVVDYFKENETVAMCVGKTVTTALLPFCFYLGTYLK